MPSNLTAFQARRLTYQGWHVRRWPWRTATGLTQIPTPDDSPLRWVRHVPGGHNIKGVDFDRILLNSDLTKADWDARDWTTEPPEGYDASTSGGGGSFANPNAGMSESGAGGIGGTGGGGGSGGSGGGGGSGTGGGGTTPTRRTRTARTAPALTVVILRTSAQTCVPLDGDGNPVPGQITDTFVAQVTMATDPGHSSDVWFLNVTHGSPDGFHSVYHGTITPGSTVTTDEFSIHANKGQTFGVWADAHLPLTGLVSSNHDEHATMRGDCAPEAPVMGCTNPLASNYDPDATMDDGSCIIDTCPAVTVGIPAGDQTVASGGSASWTAYGSTAGGHSLSYAWRKVGGDGTVLTTDQTLALTAISSGEAGGYECIVTNDCGNSEVAGVTLTVE